MDVEAEQRTRDNTQSCNIIIVEKQVKTRFSGAENNASMCFKEDSRGSFKFEVLPFLLSRVVCLVPPDIDLREMSELIARVLNYLLHFFLSFTPFNCFILSWGGVSLVARTSRCNCILISSNLFMNFSVEVNLNRYG